ncbi:MAG: o-succinylbenzoate synthase [Bacteroidales bacterium]|nr:o-succinylbenzoate synthase [Bacteroidales bacterium]
MLQARFQKHTLRFKIPGGTSRGVLKTKDSWFIFVWEESLPELQGIGECSIIRGLSVDPWPEIEDALDELCHDINNLQHWLQDGLARFPAIRFGLETALKDLGNGGKRLLFPSGFTDGKLTIPINGLIWMGDVDFMRRQIAEKIEKGFRCIKLKIGAINFEEELRLLKSIRKDFNEDELELRVDANGGFSPDGAMEKLYRLAELQVHSIEQPIRQNQWEAMARLCETTPVPIALDEELIGIRFKEELQKMLTSIRPQYIILKPGLLGGLSISEMFIREAEKQNIGWWVTSALESNVGLNAIAQWTATLNNPLPQGLGTGQLFTNNIPSPLHIDKAELYYNPQANWDLSLMR